MAAGVQGESVARNYAEALLVLARKAGDAPGWGALIRQVADAIEADVTLRTFLGTPRIASERKAAVLTAALGPRVPKLFLRFLLLQLLSFLALSSSAGCSRCIPIRPPSSSCRQRMFKLTPIARPPVIFYTLHFTNMHLKVAVLQLCYQPNLIRVRCEV